MGDFIQLPLGYGFAESLERITVCDCSSGELVDRMRLAFDRAEIPFTQVESALLSTDFTGDSRGKTYEVFRHCFERYWDYVDVIALMDEHPGFDGNVAAFIAWWTLYKSMGLFTSIPRDVHRLWRPQSCGALHVPYFIRSDRSRAICMGNVNRWSPETVVFLFREVPRTK